MNLSLRLLSACRQTYLIDGDGPVAPIAGVGPVPSTAAVGWTMPPHGVVAGVEAQDAAFVGSIPEGVVVASRGTTPSPEPDPRRFWIDWAGDFTCGLVAAEGFPGRVHDGFHQAAMRLWGTLLPLVRAAVQAHPSQAIFVAGHSKGGSLSAIIAWLLAQEFPDHVITVRAFAPARVGDDAFASAYNARITDHVRYEYDADVVPHLPADPDLAAALGVPEVVARLLDASDLGYGSVGQLSYIQADGSIVGESDGLERLRIERLIARLAAPDGLDYVAECHSVDDAGAGYVRAAYPT